MSRPSPSAPIPTLPEDLLSYLASTGAGIGAGIAFLDTEGRFLFVSEGMAAMNGLPASQHIGRPFHELSPELWRLLAEPWRRVLQGESVDFEVSLGPPLVCHGYWSPVIVDGAVVGVSATVVDVTDARRSQAREHELLQRQAALRTIANRALSDAPMLEVFNAAMRTLQEHLGVPYARVLRLMPGSDRLVEFTRTGLDEALIEAHPAGPRTGSFSGYVIEQGATVQFADLPTEGRFRRAAVFLEHGVHSGLGTPVMSGDRLWGMLGAYDRERRVFDCDEIVFLEELAAILGLMVYERDSRAFREEMLSMASHQMRTPLTSVIGLAQHIQRRIAQGRTDSVTNLVDTMVAEAWRLESVLTQWNELAAAESYRAVFASDPVEVSAAVAGRVEQFRSRHPGMRVDCAPVAPVVIASDVGRIGEILDNLMENARKYGGDAVEVYIERTASGVAIHCLDHGPGVPPEIAPFIFDRFFRGTPSGERSGMGLGLYISRKLAEGLGGTLDVTSRPGEGARFTLSLPTERRERAGHPA